MKHPTKDNGSGERPADPVSRPELDKLEKGRRKPTVEHILTPEGTTTRPVHHAVDIQREQRITHIKDRLGAARG